MVNDVEPSSLLGGIVNLKPLEGRKAVSSKGMSNLTPDKWDVWEIDGEMVDSVALYRETLLAIIQPGDIVEYECRLNMRHIHPLFFGTGDAMIYRPSTQHLWIVDYKHGSGIAVDVDDNEQLLSYAIGALKRYEGQVKRLTLAVVQPRAFHRSGPVRQQELDIVDLLIFEEFLRIGAAKTSLPDAHIEVGAQCRFCPAAAVCDDLRQHVIAVTGARFKQRVTADAMPDPKKMTADQLGRVVREVQIIEGWLRRVLAHAHSEAVNGNIPTGMKLVDKRSYRQWKDKDAVEAVLDLYDIPPEEYMTEPEEPVLLSPAQLEKALGKKLFATITDGLLTKSSPGVVLAPIEDDREAVKLDKGGAFGAASDEEDY